MRPCHHFILAFILLFPGDQVLAQATDTAKVNFVRAEVSRINQNLKSYKRVEKKYTIETTDGNSMLLYYEGNDIRKIAAVYYGESGKALHEFYFSGKKLIFCYLVARRYNKPYNIKGGGKMASTIEERVYLHDGMVFLIK